MLHMLVKIPIIKGPYSKQTLLLYTPWEATQYSSQGHRLQSHGPGLES